MEVEIIGQFYSHSRDLSNFQISVTSPYVHTSYTGDNRIVTYKITQSHYENIKSEAKRRKSNSKSKNSYKFAFLKSHVLSFPVCFLVSTKDSVWAVSHDSQKEINILKQEPKDDSEELTADQPMDIVSTECSEQETKNNTSGKCGQISVCCVTKFSGGILVCREDPVQNYWIVQEVRTKTEPVELIKIQCVNFSATSFCSYDNAELVHSAERDARAMQKYQPTIFCLEVETSFNRKKENVLKKETFCGIFGCDAPLGTVVLIGLPDGRILCHFMNSSVATMDGQTELRMLCNIEQPVHHIDISPHEEDGNVHGIIVVGVYGKIMILSPAQTSLTGDGVPEAKFSAPFMFSVSYIPSPVSKVAVCHQGVLHTTSDGKMWMTSFSKEKANVSGTQCGANDALNCQQLRYHGIKNIVALNGQREIMMCVGSDGSIHVGNFFEKNCIDHHTTEEELPILLKSLYHYGNQLQELDSVAQKQKRLFSALAVAAKIKTQDARSVSISCKITTGLPDARKFLIAVEFQNLRNFMFDPELWTLSASVSSVFQGGNTISKCHACSLEYPNISIEVDSTVFGDPIFPWLVEGGLLLNIPTGWRSLEHFASHLPLYVKIQTILINELHMLKNNSLQWSDASSDDQSERYGSKTFFSTLRKIARNKSIYDFFDTSTTGRKYDLLQEFSVLVFASSAKSICSVTEDDDLPEKLIQHIVRGSDLVGIQSSSTFMCLGSPVSISVKRKDDFLCITICCTSFPILIGLKMSLIQLLEEANHTETTKKSISMSSKMIYSLKELSAEISGLQHPDNACETGKKEFKTPDIGEELEVYKKLRKCVSATLHVL